MKVKVWLWKKDGANSKVGQVVFEHELEEGESVDVKIGEGKEVEN